MRLQDFYKNNTGKKILFQKTKRKLSCDFFYLKKLQKNENHFLLKENIYEKNTYVSIVELIYTNQPINQNSNNFITTNSNENLNFFRT